MNIKFSNKILIITAVWQRSDLTDIILSYYHRLASKSMGRMQLLAVGSEGHTSRSLCEANGWQYIERPNSPLSHKWSALTEHAKSLDFDFLIIVGSDDLLSMSLIRHYDRVYSGESNYMLGLEDLYFYRMINKRCYHFPGYPSLHTIGAGRCISRKILERINWKPWGDHSIDRGLDSRCSSHLQRNKIAERSMLMADSGGVAIDIKHYHVTISAIHPIIALSTESENILQKRFPLEYERINSTRI